MFLCLCENAKDINIKSMQKNATTTKIFTDIAYNDEKLQVYDSLSISIFYSFYLSRAQIMVNGFNVELQQHEILKN